MSAATPPIDWPVALTHRQGSDYRLAGIEIWHDFDWKEMFQSKSRRGRGASQFRHGRRLALLVLEEARQKAPGLSPVLLLTTREEEEGPRPTATHYVVVVRIDEYLKHADGDPALGYFALRLKSAITAAGRLHHLASDPDFFGTLLQSPAASQAFTAWARANAERFRDLASLVGDSEADGPSQPSSTAQVAEALAALSQIDAALLESLVSAIGKLDGRDGQRRVLEAVTNDSSGREVAASVWGRRIAERMEDARRLTEEYERLVGRDDVGETEMQDFIATHPWVVGLEYLRVIPHPVTPRGTADFLMERYDGYHDLLELKGPGDAIIEAPTDEQNRPPPPSGYSLSAALSNAIAQAQVYRRLLRENALLMKEQQAIKIAYDPHCIIVIGRSSGLADHEQRVLDDLNASLHRVEIVPFDLLGERSRRFLSNLRTYLDAERVSTPPTQRDQSIDGASARVGST